MEVDLLLSSLAAYKTAEYISQDQMKNAFLTGTCSLILAGVAIYNSIRKDI